MVTLLNAAMRAFDLLQVTIERLDETFLPVQMDATSTIDIGDAYVFYEVYAVRDSITPEEYVRYGDDLAVDYEDRINILKSLLSGTPTEQLFRH